MACVRWGGDLTMAVIVDSWTTYKAWKTTTSQFSILIIVLGKEWIHKVFYASYFTFSKNKKYVVINKLFI